jgi:hemerythrin-like domain-containing protein
MQAQAPANTRMMRIVHQAMRRDLQRARTVLATNPPPSPRQLTAVATHLTWMTQFIRGHHHAEDHGLYSLVRDRDPAAAELVDAMHADHEAIASALTAVEQAGLDTIVQAEPLHDAVDRLTDELVPHLQREEDEMMPVVSTVVTDAEWQAIDYEYNLQPKSFVELAREAHWIIDGASPEDRATVLGLVPPGPRLLLVHGFARSYRRQAAACWDPSTPPRRRVQERGGCVVHVDADLDVLWDVVRDVTRVGEWSHECVGVEWLDGATSAVPGARFRGRNRSGLFRWGRVCEIVRVQQYELVWRTLPSWLDPASTEWRIRLRPADGGTRIAQTYTVRGAPKVLLVLYGLLIPGHRDRTDALTHDMRRLGEVAVGSAPSSVPAARRS